MAAVRTPPRESLVPGVDVAAGGGAGQGKPGTATAKKPTSSGRGYRVWTISEEQSLIDGVKQLGVGSWEAIRLNPEFKLSGRTSLQLKDKWRNLVKYNHVPAALSNDQNSGCRKRTSETAEVSEQSLSPAGQDTKRQKSVSSLERGFSSSLPAVSTSDESHDSEQATQDVARLTTSSSIAFDRASAAETRVRTASDILQAALQILADANQSVSSALAASVHSTDESQSRENVRSASYIASLAQQKVVKAKAYLDETLEELAQATSSPGTSALAGRASDSEDTAESQCAVDSMKTPLSGDVQTFQTASANLTMDCYPSDIDQAEVAANVCDELRFEDWASMLLDDIDGELSTVDAVLCSGRSFPSESSFSNICAV
mmetsp:Transcript_20150/g.55895  ORF Transcript_20150/g.55895 Transcript_20150/m.55895 type:complete len:374 (+) Transcript_20150:182-1303(+)|eukprot:CAMPEP_0117663866 /NCGR_PEP_ID=MMETSP0804-20121206/8859_1 /TAXON_ID=1074897 /ORGANISM="Tetraselmis astigmatica, Strain CCMP880" /LENGTH=373 /DNA_ID=CAMNT_0005470949 /DNA_START=158 /DNA_END=1279 /DNA_ORIENTATION=+